MSRSVKIFAFFDISQKVIIHLFCTIAFGYFMIQSVLRYQEKKTGTVDEYRSIDKVQFPEISICPSVGYKLSSKDAFDYRNSHKWVPDNIGNNMTASEYYANIAYSPTDLVSNVRIIVKKTINGKDDFKFNATSQPICGNEDTGMIIIVYVTVGPKC
jgi:hypothetical protein